MTTTQEEAKRLKEEREARTRKIRFQCSSKLPCFNTCCRDVNIFLSPYDILRMKNHVNMPSREFHRAYTRTLLPGPGKIPIIQLKMLDEDRACPFVKNDGCSIYEDRPWACRMYPLDKSDETGAYDFIVGADRCHGQNESVEWVIRDWFLDQGLPPYEDMDERFKLVTQYPRLQEAGIDDVRVQQMFWMACYDLDTFRRFVLDTRFLQTFEVEEDVVEIIKTDDLALLELALRWIRFGLVCGDVLPIKEELMKKDGKEGPVASDKGSPRKGRKE